MPFINVKTTTTVTEDTRKELYTQICKITESCLKKSENWVMLSVEDNSEMYFQKSTEQIVYVEVKALGDISATNSENMTSQVTNYLSGALQIPKDRIYVAYFGTNNWGWNGSNF